MPITDRAAHFLLISISPEANPEKRVEGAGEYFVVSDGDEGDEAKGKHREVLLRFDRNVVATYISDELQERGRSAIEDSRLSDPVR
jgi:hypothetical protein